MAVDGVGIVKNHPTYYLRDGNVCFLVEDTIFRFYKHFFERESKFFQNLFSEGDSHGTKPPPQYKLDVTVDEFATLCWLWDNPKYDYAGQRKETWLTILSLATKWQFNEIRGLAVRQLQKVDLEPVERIEIYKRYNVTEQLLLPSYMALCRSPTLPSPAEAEKLTMHTLLRIASARERALLSAAASGCATPTSASAPDNVLECIIVELFGLTPLPNDKSVPGEGQAANTANTDVIAIGDPPVKKKKSPNDQTNLNGRENPKVNPNSKDSKGKSTG